MGEMKHLSDKGIPDDEYFKEACTIYNTVMEEICEEVSKQCVERGNLLRSVWLEFNNLVDWRMKKANDYAKEKEHKFNEFSLNIINKLHEKYKENEKTFSNLQEQLREQELINSKAMEKVQQYRGDYKSLNEYYNDLKTKYEEQLKENEKVNILNNELKLLFSQGSSLQKCKILIPICSCSRARFCNKRGNSEATTSS